jgi:hypothetical protein
MAGRHFSLAKRLGRFVWCPFLLAKRPVRLVTRLCQSVQRPFRLAKRLFPSEKSRFQLAKRHFSLAKRLCRSTRPLCARNVEAWPQGRKRRRASFAPSTSLIGKGAIRSRWKGRIFRPDRAAPSHPGSLHGAGVDSAFLVGLTYSTSERSKGRPPASTHGRAFSGTQRPGSPPLRRAARRDPRVGC